MSRPSTGAVQVLFVGDRRDSTAAASRLEEERARFTVETAADAEAGLTALADERVDCVVSGYDLPRTDGIEFLEAVRADHDDLPFVLYTGAGSEAVAAEAVSAGATDYLPRDPERDQSAALADRVADAVDQCRARRERRRERDRELAAARRRFDAVFNNPFAFMGLLDPDGTVTAVNETAMAFVEWSRDEVLGEPVHETPWWNHSSQLQADLREWLDRAADGEVVRYEADHVSGTGERVTVDGVLTPIRDDDGTVVSVLAAGRDVSERREHARRIDALHDATRELIAAESETEIGDRIAETATDLLALPHTGVHLYDEDDESLVPVAWTETVAETIGEPPALERDSLAWEAFTAEETRVFDDLDGHERRHNPETPLRSELIVPLGEYGVVIVASESRAAFDRDDRRLIELLCGNATAALHSVSREQLLRERERQLERQNDRLEQFASTVSHDLRNPLNVAEGRLELVAADCEPESDHVDAIRRAHDWMGTLIEDLLALARADESPFEPEPLALRAVARGCWQHVETTDATLVVDTDRTVRADESRLRQVFENLIRNAVEHGSTSPPSRAPEDAVGRGGAVTVTVGDLPDGFYVADDGPGIPEDERADVFDTGYSTAEGGTGFGLHIVEQVAETHGWTVRVTDSADGGARFEVSGVDVLD
jgi:PAS domain S-box-containing protein